MIILLGIVFILGSIALATYANPVVQLVALAGAVSGLQLLIAGSIEISYTIWLIMIVAGITFTWNCITVLTQLNHDIKTKRALKAMNDPQFKDSTSKLSEVLENLKKMKDINKKD